MKNIYLSEDKTQFTISCIANMIRAKNYKILEEFVNERNLFMRANIYFIAQEIDSTFVEIMDDEKWRVSR